MTMTHLLPTLELIYAAFRALAACVPLPFICRVWFDGLACCVVAVVYSGRYSVTGMSRFLAFHSSPIMHKGSSSSWLR